jgi:hypothetical protein
MARTRAQTASNLVTHATPVTFPVDRPAIRLGEDRFLVVRLGAGQHPFAQLGGLVRVYGGDGLPVASAICGASILGCEVNFRRCPDIGPTLRRRSLLKILGYPSNGPD